MATLSTNFYDLVEHTCSAIKTFEKRKNKRSEREQEGFEAAVKYILELLWKSHQSYPYRLPKINLNKNYYSSSNIYKKQDLTYRILIENVYLPLQKMGWIKEERKGYNDRSGEGQFGHDMVQAKLQVKADSGVPRRALKHNYQA